MSSQIPVTSNTAKEIREISKDFENPIEVIREALHNSYDAGAKQVLIYCYPQTLKDGRRALSLDITDDGCGMTNEQLGYFFSLGYSDKESIPGREAIGFKGHGTKIYYQAQDIWVLTRREGGALLLAEFVDARTKVNAGQLPVPVIYDHGEAQSKAAAMGLEVPSGFSTVLRLVDFTPDSQRIIDDFKQAHLENYLRWFTVFGSFKHIVVEGSKPPPMKLFVQGTDKTRHEEIQFGHPWPVTDCVDVKEMKRKDPRRPFNYFQKTFRIKDYATEGSYLIDIAAIFEGSRARMDRDKCIRARGKKNTFYREEDRYGLWLCKDWIPIDKRFEWLSDDDCPSILEEIDPRRALIFVNCQQFSLTANRGSVGNSSSDLLKAVRQSVYRFLDEKKDDPDLQEFANEYREEQFSRLREKDKKALHRRIERFNKKNVCKIMIPPGREYQFFEPQREITLFGLISELRAVAPEILELNILDYDDHKGIDLLVKRNGDPSNLLDRTKVAYTELKYELTGHVNHPFDNLHSIICWESSLSVNDPVIDATNAQFTYRETKDDNGVTHSRLLPPDHGDATHTIKVIVLERYLREKFGMTKVVNPLPISLTAASGSGARGKGKRR